MNYIVFDLEWNQSNTGREPEVEELPFEIIEIGAVKLNSEMKFIGEFSQLVKPEVYQEMHYITRKLIHIQMAELQGGRPFPIVMDEFLDWCGEDCVFCTWGPLDLMELQRNMRFYDMTPLSDKPFKFYDVQKLFSLAYEDGKINIYLGNYSDYEITQEVNRLEREKNLIKEKKEDSYKNRVKPQKVKFTFNEAQEFKNIDSVISDLENRIYEIDKEIAENPSNYELLQKLTEEKEEVEIELLEKYERKDYLDKKNKEIQESRN